MKLILFLSIFRINVEFDVLFLRAGSLIFQSQLLIVHRKVLKLLHQNQRLLRLCLVSLLLRTFRSHNSNFLGHVRGLVLCGL